MNQKDRSGHNNSGPSQDGFVDHRFYTTSWVRTAPAILSGNSPSAGNANSESAIDLESTPGSTFGWLIYLDKLGFGETVAALLEEKGHKVVRVKKGKAFSPVSGRRPYRINPLDPGDYTRLFTHISKKQELPRYHLHLWSIDDNPGEYTPSFFSLCYIAISLGRFSPNISHQLTVVSDRIHDVTGHDITHPQAALLLGPVHVIPLEFPSIKCSNIDIDLSSIERIPGPETHLAAELDNLSIRHKTTRIVALRGQHRWHKTYTPLNLEASQKITGYSTKIPRLKQNGNYLVTGGLSGTGLLLAQYIARNTNSARLILTGPTKLPAPADWEQKFVEYGADHPLGRKMVQVRELEESGAKVLVYPVDSADFAQMITLVELVEMRYGPIDGIIHAATSTDSSDSIIDCNRENVESLLVSKVTGTMVLDQIFKERTLDFFILCATLASVQPVAGQVIDCATNSFLDAYAYYKTAISNTFTVSINWSRKPETGMGPGKTMNYLKENISPEEVGEAFGRVLSAHYPQVICCHQEINTTM